MAYVSGKWRGETRRRNGKTQGQEKLKLTRRVFPDRTTQRCVFDECKNPKDEDNLNFAIDVLLIFR